MSSVSTGSFNRRVRSRSRLLALDRILDRQAKEVRTNSSRKAELEDFDAKVLELVLSAWTLSGRLTAVLVPEP